jgi:Xaa-Pro aminopeptidase
MPKSTVSSTSVAKSEFSARLQALRASLARDGLSAYLLPVHDESLGEYPPAHRRRLEWLCGFSGSAGWAIVTADKAVMLVDGRYTLQVRDQVDVALYETHNSADMPPMQWLAKALAGVKNPTIGYDAWLISHLQASRWQNVLAKKLERDVIWVADKSNRIDALWQDRPADPLAPAVVWPVAYSGRSRAEKETLLAAVMEATGLDAVLLTNPESPCWLLNLRGADLPTTPQLNCTALVQRSGKQLTVSLFVALEKISEQVKADALAGVKILPESELANALKQLPKAIRLGVDPASTPRAATLALEAADVAWIAGDDPCLLPRACKHHDEQTGMREAHRRDGLAVVQFLHWLDETLSTQASGAWPTEIEIGEKILEFRSAQPDFWGPSFETIAGFGSNGAIVHYRAEPHSNLQLQEGSLLLLDSGGQYPMGTTDITRTIAIGEPTQEMKERNTRVLAGHITLANAVFPQGTAGSQLDVLARAPLWEVGLDFDHGTGHGVGTFLNVHEGPQRISKRAGDHVALQPGMVVSNEPGYYKTGEYGIRIENLVMVVEDDVAEDFLRFDTITCVPIDRRLIVPELLSDEQREWLNSYHAWVEHVLAPDLPPAARVWLNQACAAI